MDTTEIKRIISNYYRGMPTNKKCLCIGRRNIKSSLYPKQSSDSLKSQSKYQCHSTWDNNNNNNIHVETQGNTNS